MPDLSRRRRRNRGRLNGRPSFALRRKEGFPFRFRLPRVFYGWYVVLAAFLILFVTGGGSTMIGVMIKPISSDMGWTRAATSSAVFLNMAIFAVSLIVTGRLYDRFGPRWIIPISVALFAAGYALTAATQSLWQFLLAYGVVAAAGTGGSTVPMFASVVGRWFQARRGLAVSIALSGYSLGQFFLIPVFSDLVAGSGWRVTCLWIAGLSAVVGLALSLGVIRGDPRHYGLAPYGAQSKSAGLLPGEQGEAGVPAEVVVSRDLGLREAMRTRSLWLFVLVMFICGGGDHLVTTHLVPMVTDYGISSDVAANMLAWLGLLGLGGMLAAGPAADAIGNRAPIAITFALRVALFLLVLFIAGLVPYWIFSVGFGFTLMVTAPLTATVVSNLYGVTHIGFISGFITTIHMVGGGLWGYLGGLIFDRTGDYRLALAISAGLAVVAIVCTLLMQEKRQVIRS
ncbi:MAG: MFS transporter [Thermoleophilia bacterium]|nr:MFS transporter [Thermoleophilia bacterium]